MNSTTDLLILASFLFLLHLARIIAQTTIKAGLIGEIILGAIYGAPLANILHSEWQSTLTALGYLGLILIVFEGALSTNLSLLFRNLGLSILCALTGVLLPIGLSILLLSTGFGYTVLASFAAGAALSATSLGTTFAVLQTDHGEGNSALFRTRIAVVLLSAAMIDDIIALIMASVIESIEDGTESHRSLGWAIGRPILASFAMSILILVLGFFMMRLPRQLKIYINKLWTTSLLRRYRKRTEFIILFFTLTSISAGAAYAGTSVLYGAFLAGLLLTYVIPVHLPQRPTSPSDDPMDRWTNILDVFNSYLLPLQSRLLSPLFFASIGFSIPLRQMFTTHVLWRGFVYALLMVFAKAAVGVWVALWHQISSYTKRKRNGSEEVKASVESPPEIEQRVESGTQIDLTTNNAPDRIVDKQALDAMASVTTAKGMRSWFLPASFLGSGMVARGEIGLLIAQIAYSNGQGILPTDLFLISLWALVLNTIVGPIIVSMVLSRWGVTLMDTDWGLGSAGISNTR
ncbi:Hsp70 ATPase ssc1 [Serendipita sp. 405]|nr:Hsp70 ATPase ssc1 [Serendipita sp. 405]